MKKELHGLITGVVSGDHLLVQGKETEEEPPATKDLYISFASAPRMATPQRAGEPFAFAAREFIRRFVISKRVSFTLDYSRDGRDYATVWIDENGKKFDIAVELIKEGLAKAVIVAVDKERSNQLKSLEKSAKPKNLWTKDNSEKSKNTYNIIYPGSKDYTLDKIAKEKALNAIVEYTFSPTLFNVLLTDHNTMVKVSLECLLNLSGDAVQEKYNKKAKAFAERLVQHRDIVVTVGECNKAESLVCGRILVGESDLGCELAANGYAKLKTFNTKMDSKYYDSLQIALANAKEERKGIWNVNAKPTVSPKQTGTEKQKQPKPTQKNPVVIEINSGDSLTVLEGNKEQKIYPVSYTHLTLPTNREV
eukprot:TRINITY_DN13958_c0_g2_i1.p1 TRINITY_DN13958_c0_g2~~TRINITY_DN13958_c0_g2_i1.p1  ORF type:complete len:364 (+),score=77.20 TRINITY_DN13958_c0_g2_i1:74-1165(+)